MVTTTVVRHSNHAKLRSIISYIIQVERLAPFPYLHQQHHRHRNKHHIYHESIHNHKDTIIFSKYDHLVLTIYQYYECPKSHAWLLLGNKTPISKMSPTAHVRTITSPISATTQWDSSAGLSHDRNCVIKFLYNKKRKFTHFNILQQKNK